MSARQPVQLRRLKYTATINDDALGEETDTEYELQYVDIGNVDSSGTIHEIAPYRFAEAPSRARRRVRDGDVIISCVRTYLQAIAPIQSPPDNLIVSTGFAVVRPRAGVLDPAFGKYALREPRFLAEVEMRSVGVSYPAINASDLADIAVHLPPTSQQRAIADYLDRETARLDALVAAKERVLGLLAEKRRALITRAVTRGLGPRAPLRDSGIPWLGEIPAHWEAMRLKRLVAIPITDGPHETPEFVSDGIEFISAEAIQEDAIDFERRRGFITPQLHAAYCRKTRPQRDDILFCKSGATTGKLARVLVDHEFSIWSPLAVIRADPHVALPAYLEVCLRADVVQDQVRQTWSAGTQPNIAMGAINELWLAVPPIGEQAAILSALDVQMTNFDEIKSKTVRTVGLLKERRAALIAAAVTGQIDVEHAA